MSNIRDTELYQIVGRINLHGHTKPKDRLTDGKRHPVRIMKPAPPTCPPKRLTEGKRV